MSSLNKFLEKRAAQPKPSAPKVRKTRKKNSPHKNLVYRAGCRNVLGALIERLDQCGRDSISRNDLANYQRELMADSITDADESGNGFCQRAARKVIED